jgi:Flp pilus assembly protein TadG
MTVSTEIGGKEPRPDGVRLGRPQSYRVRSDAGQALVEFLVVVPVLLLLFFGIVELGAAWRTSQVITNTAREGARQAVLPTGTQARVDSIVNDRLVSAGLNPADALV